MRLFFGILGLLLFGSSMVLHAQSTSANTAIIPVPKLENDSYNWWDRHKKVMSIKDSINPEIVLIGNSITHFWGGLPQIVDNNGRSRRHFPPRDDARFHSPCFPKERPFLPINAPRPKVCTRFIIPPGIWTHLPIHIYWTRIWDRNKSGVV